MFWRKKQQKIRIETGGGHYVDVNYKPILIETRLCLVCRGYIKKNEWEEHILAHEKEYKEKYK